MREEFIGAASAVLDDDPRTAVVLADISADGFAAAAARHPDRVINVGIREQLMIGVAGGLALTGLRPIAHSYAPFAVDRVYEQLKLDLDHQGVGAVVVSVGASYDASSSGRTHQSPGDVALVDTLTGWTVHVPGHPGEVAPLLRAAVDRDDPVYLRLSTQANRRPVPVGPVRHGSQGMVLAVGPMLDPVLAATEGLDLTVAYTHTPRPLDGKLLRALAGRAPKVILVEPYLAGTSAWAVAGALRGVPHDLLALGVGRTDLRSYGAPADHAERHGLHPAGIRRSILAFLEDVAPTTS